MVSDCALMQDRDGRMESNDEDLQKDHKYAAKCKLAL